MNRLDGSISPYLQSHADQPVDWYPWGEEAFAEAARRDVPVLISIGYQTCHWCHVMSRETFSDPRIAESINKRMVAIKVDREEHPDVDAAYTAQAIAFGTTVGWPLNIFANAEGIAIFATTYLPPVPRMNQQAFGDVVVSISRAWTKKRSEVRAGTRELKLAVQEAALVNARTGVSKFPSRETLGGAAQDLGALEDTTYGGFGTGPKFPVAPALRFLLGREAAGDEEAGRCARRTLSNYAMSALRDPLEGGCFRYATNRDFSSPHYERMLDDNASLLSVYSRAGMVDIAAGIVTFLRDQLLVGEAFGSGQHSESVLAGEVNEGGYYALDAAGRNAVEPPPVDGKIITGWNGLALEALAQAHRAGVPGDPGALGVDIATWLIAHHIKDDHSVIRLSRDGRASSAVASLGDYGGLALGLIELGMALGRADFVRHGQMLVDFVKQRGIDIDQDPILGASGLGWTPDIAEGSAPSGHSLLALASIRLASVCGDDTYREYAWFLLSPLMKQALSRPTGMGGVLAALSELTSTPRQVIVVGEEESPLSHTAREHHREGTVVMCVNSAQAQEFLDAGFSIFEGRTTPEVSTAYVCTEGVCELPVSDAVALAEQLAR